MYGEDQVRVNCRSAISCQVAAADTGCTSAATLGTMSTVVDTAVDGGIRSYCQVVAQTIEESVPVLSEEKLKKVFQEAATDDDRSKNVIIFGMTEENSEDLDCKITALFGEIEEKPSFEAARVGMISSDRIRPVKVFLRNSETVNRLLFKTKKLKTTARYRRVYIAPDRSPEEREKHRQLVAEIKRQANEDPDRHYYLLDGEICMREKN